MKKQYRLQWGPKMAQSGNRCEGVHRRLSEEEAFKEWPGGRVCICWAKTEVEGAQVKILFQRDGIVVRKTQENKHEVSEELKNGQYGWCMENDNKGGSKWGY